jgi:uncharacterized protein YdaU (DUF1376 family)
VNFFKLYIGDYQRDTGTLTLAEHGAYMLMLQYLYATEQPLPTGRDLHRLLRAESKAERDAIDAIAAKFWTLTDAGLVNVRALEEIRKSEHQRTVNREIGKRGGRPRKSEPAAEGITDSVTEHETDSVSVRKPNRNPNHSHIDQEQDQKLLHARTPSPDLPASVPNGTEAGRACLLLRQAGCTRVNPSRPELIAALAEGVTPEALVDTYREHPDAANPFAWAIATARSRHAEGAKPVTPNRPPGLRQLQASPSQSRTLLAMNNLDQAVAHVQHQQRTRLDSPDSQDRAAEAALPEPRRPAVR